MVRRSLFSRLFARIAGGRELDSATGQRLPAGASLLAARQPMVAAAGAGVSSGAGAGASREVGAAGASRDAAGSSGAVPSLAGSSAAGSLGGSGSSGSAAQISARPPASYSTPSSPGGATPVRVETVEPSTNPLPAPVEALRKVKDVKSSRLAPQEELSIKISDGLSNLSGLLDQIDNKLATQNDHQVELREQMSKLPVVLSGMAETQKASLDAVRDVRAVLQEQVKTSMRQAESLEKLPGVVEGVGAKVDAQNQTGLKVRESVETVGKSVRNLADSSQRAQNTMLSEFRRAQDEHRRRLEELVDRERKTILVVAGLALLVVVCLVLILVNQTGG